MKRVVIIIVVVLLALIGAAAAFLFLKKPAQRLASPVQIHSDATLIDRGRYLANNVSLCVHCHSEKQGDRYGFPPQEVSIGDGGSQCWDDSSGNGSGFKVCPSNITPDAETGLGVWSDGEIIRAVREGIDRSGEALFPLMPYTEYRSLSDSDMHSIVAYLRSLRPVHRAVPERHLPVPLSIIVKFIPAPLDGAVPDPNRNDELAMGRYLATVAGCKLCHTPVDQQHRPIAGRDFAGGQAFAIPRGGQVVSSNLTPHETGLRSRSRAEFVALFKGFAAPEMANVVVPPGQNTVMPWLSYAHMTDEDLGAIYAYLHTLTPIENRLEKRIKPKGAEASSGDASVTDAAGGADTGIHR